MGERDALAPSYEPDSLAGHSGFAAFWLAGVASGFGFQMLSVAVGWQVYAITGRALDLGLIGLVQFVPSVLLALPAGHAADQLDRRRIVLFGLVVEWLTIAALASPDAARTRSTRRASCP